MDEQTGNMEHMKNTTSQDTGHPGQDMCICVQVSFECVFT